MDHGKGEKDIGHLILVDISCFQKMSFRESYIYLEYHEPPCKLCIYMITYFGFVGYFKTGGQNLQIPFLNPHFFGGGWSDYISFGSKRRHGCQALKTYIWFPAYI